MKAIIDTPKAPKPVAVKPITFKGGPLGVSKPLGASSSVTAFTSKTNHAQHLKRVAGEINGC